MEITLRQAKTLQDTVKERLREIGHPTYLTELNVFSPDTAGDLQAAESKTSVLTNRWMELTFLLYSLRDGVGVANAKAINGLLAEDAYLKSREQMLKALLEQVKNIESRPAVIQEMVRAARVRSENPSRRDIYGGDGGTVQVSALSDKTKSELVQLLRDVGKRRRAIADELIVANVTTKITLASEAVRVLNSEQLV